MCVYIYIYIYIDIYIHTYIHQIFLGAGQEVTVEWDSEGLQ